jgi:hypothetical protein
MVRQLFKWLLQWRTFLLRFPVATDSIDRSIHITALVLTLLSGMQIELYNFAGKICLLVLLKWSV